MGGVPSILNGLEWSQRALVGFGALIRANMVSFALVLSWSNISNRILVCMIL